MSNFTLPLNWQDDYFEKIDFTDVVEVYGKLREDFFGGGKSSMQLPEPSKKMVEQTIKEAHAKKIEVNYLLNTTCIGNLEFTKKGYKQIRKMFDWLSSIGVDAVTVALPFIAQISKRYYPHLKLNISTQADVDSLEKAKYWETLGADLITLSHTGMNRNFHEIKRITKNCKFDTQLIANTFCKRGCPFVTLHGNFSAHASHSWEKTNRFNMDYYFTNCVGRAFCDPLTLIQSNWIRPEDINLYEDLGIKRFKITERGMKSEYVARIVNAYRNKSYDGNFFDIVPTLTKYVFMEKRNFAKTMKELMRVSFVDIKKVRRLVKQMEELTEKEKRFADSKFYVDCKKLDGAIQFFMKKGCMQTTCTNCDFCNNLVEVAIKQEDISEYTQFFSGIADDLVEGKYF